MNLITASNISNPDGAYAALLARHKGLSEAESAALNARLILILMNHLGDSAIFEQALDLARPAR